MSGFFKSVAFSLRPLIILLILRTGSSLSKNANKEFLTKVKSTLRRQKSVGSDSERQLHDVLFILGCTFLSENVGNTSYSAL